MKWPSEVEKVIAIFALFFVGLWVAYMVWFWVAWEF